jgi:hypothetical protein
VATQTADTFAVQTAWSKMQQTKMRNGSDNKRKLVCNAQVFSHTIQPSIRTIQGMSKASQKERNIGNHGHTLLGRMNLASEFKSELR